MSPREAIQMIDRILDPDPWEDYGLSDKAKEALQMAVDALEKQIPKKVIITASTKRCAVCHRQLSGIGNIHPTRLYCQKCGQAIDWTEGE